MLSHIYFELGGPVARNLWQLCPKIIITKHTLIGMPFRLFQTFTTATNELQHISESNIVYFQCYFRPCDNLPHLMWQPAPSLGQVVTFKFSQKNVINFHRLINYSMIKVAISRSSHKLPYWVLTILSYLCTCATEKENESLWLLAPFSPTYVMD